MKYLVVANKTNFHNLSLGKPTFGVVEKKTIFDGKNKLATREKFDLNTLEKEVRLN